LAKLGKTHGWTEPEDLDTVASLAPHRPFKIIYGTLYIDLRPTFVVDITDQFERKVESLLAYRSQYDDQQTGSGLFPMRDEVRKRLETMAEFYGLLGGVKYAEPFVQKEVRVEDDLLAIPVKSL
jgi:LmbE family N-acetylglucosaminyl deacetylase